MALKKRRAAQNINSLPEPLRRYIHDLETVCDPAGDVAERFRLREESKLLRRECERLAALAGEDPRLPARSGARRAT